MSLNNWQVDCKTVKFLEVFRSMAKECGWIIGSVNWNSNWLFFCLKEGRWQGVVDRYVCKQSNTEIVSIEEAIIRIEAGPPKDEEKATPEIQREFIKALASCEVGSFAVRHGWPDINGGVDSYYRQIAQLVVRQIDG